MKIQDLAQKQDIGLAELGNLSFIYYIWSMDMADRIEEVMMQAYKQGVHEQVFETVKQIQHDHRFDLAKAYEVAFEQTMSRHEHTDSEN